jgi:hypothetical protein
MKTSTVIVSCVAMTLGWAACGSDDETPAPAADEADASQEAGSDEATSATEPATDSDSDSGELDAPSIDPATMPASGNLQFVVDGSTYDFDISTYDCQVGPDIVFVGATDESDVFISATNSGDGGWAGQLQISEPDGDRIYGSLAGLEGTFAVDGTMAAYEGNFGWTTRANPGVSEDAGIGTVRIAC